MHYTVPTLKSHLGWGRGAYGYRYMYVRTQVSIGLRNDNSSTLDSSLILQWPQQVATPPSASSLVSIAPFMRHVTNYNIQLLRNQPTLPTLNQSKRARAAIPGIPTVCVTQSISDRMNTAQVLIFELPFCLIYLPFCCWKYSLNAQIKNFNLLGSISSRNRYQYQSVQIQCYFFVRSLDLRDLSSEACFQSRTLRSVAVLVTCIFQLRWC